MCPAFLYPGHKYLGPGNPLNNGEPVDSADRIAQVHDIEYSKAKSFGDIHSSDLKAIKSFGSDFTTKPNLPSAAGFVGLGVKYLTESAINRPIYPFSIGKYIYTEQNATKKKNWCRLCQV